MFPAWRIFALVTLAARVFAQKSAKSFMSAVLDPSRTSIQLVPGTQQGAIAWGSFQDSIHQEGWSYLEIRTNPTFEDEVAAYAAGALESALSRDLIKYQEANVFGNYCINNTEYCDKLERYFSEQLAWMNERAREERHQSPFWHQVYLILKQMAGLEDGYNNRTLTPANNYTVVSAIYFMNNEGTIYDLESAFERRPDNHSIFGTTPCSLLVKITPQDLLLGHTTWSSYRMMLRVQKKYMLNYHYLSGSSWRVPGHTVSMSSYPGKLNSLDDFYVVSTGLVVSETTNDLMNNTLFAFIKPTTVPTGFRAMIANRLAKDGRHWTRTFEKHNSGTYNNQWIVIDYNKVNVSTDGIHLSNETFWMLEQLPTLIVSRDMTDTLRAQGYWASYNVPYFAGIYNESGYRAKFIERGDRYSHDNCPRGKIFRRDQFRVTDPTSMLTMLRYNDYQQDPFSACNCTPPYSPVYTIAARYDLLAENGHYDEEDLTRKAVGAIDVKVADLRSLRDFSFTAISGPTNDMQPTFVWSKSKFHYKPFGHPDVFDFKPVRHKWNL